VVARVIGLPAHYHPAMTSPSANPEQLTCLSIIVCDEIYRDERTKKQIIVGTFNRIGATEFPVRHPKMSVLVSVTNGRGNYELKVTVVNASTEALLMEVSGPFTMNSPLDIIDINLEIVGIIFPSPGKYWVNVEADGNLIASRPVRVEKVDKPPEVEVERR